MSYANLKITYRNGDVETYKDIEENSVKVDDKFLKFEGYYRHNPKYTVVLDDIRNFRIDQ